MLLLSLLSIPLAFGQGQQGARRPPTTHQAVIADGQRAIPGSNVTGPAAVDITLSVDPPNTNPNPATAPCFPRGDQKLRLTNHGQKTIDLAVSHQYWPTPDGPPVGDPPLAPGIVSNGTVVPSGQFTPGCTTYFNGDVNNPIYYVIVYTIVATYHQNAPPNTGGGPPCTPGPPRIAYCPPINVPDGVYYLRAAQVGFPAVFENGQLRDRGGPACIDVRTQDGRYQQLKCEGVPSSMFKLDRSDNGCYLIRQALPPERLTLTNADNDNDGVAKLLGYTDSQISGCSFDQARIHWQLELVYPPAGPGPDLGDFHIKNQATGKCIQIDGSEPVHAAGTVNAINNCSTKYQEWILQRALP